jgi:hypothetical protein
MDLRQKRDRNRSSELIQTIDYNGMAGIEIPAMCFRGLVSNSSSLRVIRS